jgi:hypothetical protein
MSDSGKSFDPNAGREAKIRERAYAIWLDQGQVHDRDKEHWLEAETEIDREAAPVKSAEVANKSAATKPKVAPAKAASTKATAAAKPNSDVKSAARGKDSNGIGTRA